LQQEEAIDLDIMRGFISPVSTRGQLQAGEIITLIAELHLFVIYGTGIGITNWLSPGNFDPSPHWPTTGTDKQLLHGNTALLSYLLSQGLIGAGQVATTKATINATGGN
jgi:hypothetical protein